MNSAIEKRFANVARSKTFSNLIKRYSLSERKVLDIGCTHGEFLKHFGHESIGLTISSEEEKVAKERNLNVLLSNIEQDELPEDFNKKFDVIFANNIFEHMQSPHNFLIKIKPYLKLDGLLILGVPCIPYLTPLIHLKKFRGALASLHINFFTRSTLIKSVEYAGWDIVEVRGFHFSNSFIDYLLNLIYPHFYVVAKINEKFQYSPKRLKELEGYNSRLLNHEQ